MGVMMSLLGRRSGCLRWFAAIAVPTLGAAGHERVDFVLQNQLKRPEPFAESRLQINPVTFRWLAVDGATSYRIEWSRRADFHEASSTVTTEPFLRPLEPLDPGRWFWRTRVETPERGPWAQPEHFELSSSLPRWPVRPWTEYLAKIPADHPRAYVTRTDLPALQAKAARLGPRLDTWKDSVRATLEKPFNVADYEAKVPAGAENKAPAHPDRKLLIWASKEASYDLAKPITDAAWLWLATRDSWFRDAARERALAAARMDPHGFLSEEFSDFGNAAMVANLGIAYDFLYDEFSVEERAFIRRVLIERARPIFARMARASQQLMRGHDWQHAYLDALVGALALHGEEPEASAWVDLALRTFTAFYPWFGGNDGGSFEGAKYYYSTEMIPSLKTLDVFRTTFQFALDEGNPWFRANPYYLIYAFPPGSAWARLGDTLVGVTDREDNPPQPLGRARIAAARMAELYDHGHAAAYAAALPEDDVGFAVGEFLRWSLPATVAPKSLETLPPARLFADIGTVFTHSAYTRPQDNVRFVFHAGPYGAFGHGHADQNSFHLIAYNEDLLIDSGYFTPAGDPHRQQWTIRTFAHNTVLVDGKGQPYGDNRGHARISHYEETDRWVYWVGSAEHAYPETPLERFDRHVLWLRGGDVETYVIFDDLRSAGGIARTFDWLLHAENRLEIDLENQQVRARGEKGDAVVTFLEPASLSFHQDDDFGGYPAVYWRNDENFPLPNQWHLKATPEPAVEKSFFAVIQVSRSGAAKPPIRSIKLGVETAGWTVHFDANAKKLVMQPLP